GPRKRIGRNSVRDGMAEIDAIRARDLALTAVDDALHFLPEGSHVGKEDEIRSWTDRAHDRGYKVLGYYNSLFADTANSPIRATVDEGLSQGYFLKNTVGEPSVVQLISGELLDVLQVDFTNPDATKWFQTTLDWGLELGYDGWMWDFG